MQESPEHDSHAGNAEHQLSEFSRQPAKPSRSRPTGWYFRGYLPHFNNPGTIQSVTFRLADSLPQSKLAAQRQLHDMDTKQASSHRRKQIESWLDAGMGCCALGHPALANLLQDTLLKFNGERYRLFAWCIMPNHVHALLETKDALAAILQSWKSYTGRWAMKNRAALRLGVPGKALWMREYWDRYIRDAVHFESVLRYIEQNPVKANLCHAAENWKWSSAGVRHRMAE